MTKKMSTKAYIFINRLKIIYGLLACLISIIFIEACSDLETTDNSFVTPSEFLKTEEGLLSFIAPAYAPLREAMKHTSLLAAQEVSSDEICIPIRGQDWVMVDNG